MVLGRLVAGRLFGALAVLLLAGIAVGARVSGSAAGTVPSTSTTTSTVSWSTFPRLVLNAMSCVASGCVGVGEEDLTEQVALPFVERQVRGVWQHDSVLQPSLTTKRSSALNAVSCWSATGCAAIGTFFPSCCDEKAFAEVLTGSVWQLQRHVGPSGYQPNALSCPGARFCMSVGDGADRASVVQWNGRRWLRDRTPDPNTDPNTDLESGQAVSLTAVSCPERHDCVAVGTWAPPNITTYRAQAPNRPLGEIYHDGKWVIQQPEAHKHFTYDLTSVSCPTAAVCMAVGSSGAVHARSYSAARVKPFAEFWDGVSWVSQRLPEPTRPGSLESVSCASPRSCLAVGTNLNGSPATFADRWNGHHWTQRILPIGSQASEPPSLAAFCTTTRTCTAAAWAWPQTTPTLARPDGNRWTVQSHA